MALDHLTQTMTDRPPSDPDLAQAWAALRANTPGGWFIGTPGQR